MKKILVVLFLLAVGAHAEEMDYVATTEISVAQGGLLLDSLESAGLTGFSRNDLMSAINSMQPDHSFLLKQDVTMDGATRTVQFAIQKVSNQNVEFSILSYGKKFAERMQSIMNSIHKSPAE